MKTETKQDKNSTFRMLFFVRNKQLSNKKNKKNKHINYCRNDIKRQVVGTDSKINGDLARWMRRVERLKSMVKESAK